jgi:hypothetical protein
MFISLPQLFPGHVSPWVLLSIIVLVLALDAILLVSIVALGALFVVFKAGKMAYVMIDRTIDRLIVMVLRIVEDVLESPPLDRVPLFSWALVGVKKAYDIINGAQGLVVVAINIGVTLLAAFLFMACVAALAVVNLSALFIVLNYLA